MELEQIINLINNGEPERKLSEKLGIAQSTLRSRIKKAGYSRNEEKKYIKASNSDSKEENTAKIQKDNQNENSDDIIKSNRIERGKEIRMDIQPDSDEKIQILNMLKGIELDKPAKRYKGFYLDADICDIIDSIKVGNKSDFVSKIIRVYMQENNLL